MDEEAPLGYTTRGHRPRKPGGRPKKPVAVPPQGVQHRNQGLTERERMFAIHYAGPSNFNGSHAALAAGCPQKSAGNEANRMLKRPPVVALIAEEIGRRADRARVDGDWVLAEAVVLFVESKAIPDQTAATRKERREMLKLIGEHVNVGAFRRNVGLSGPTGGPVETVDLAMLARLSDEELAAMEAARAIMDRHGASDPDSGGPASGEGEA